MKRHLIIVLWLMSVLWMAMPVSEASGYYNVKDYGAYGNGFLDDTTGIQAAIDAAGENGGGLVLLPFGNYVLKGSLRLRSGVHIFGDNGTKVQVKLTKAASALVVENAENVHISSLAFTSSDPAIVVLEYSGTTDLLVEEISVEGATLAVSGALPSADVTFRYNQADGLGEVAAAFRINGTERLQILDHIISGYEKNGIIEGADGGGIERNHFQNGEIEISDSRNFIISANTISEGGIRIEAEQTRIFNNHIINPAECGIKLLDGCREITVRANVLRSRDNNKDLISSEGSCTNLEISGNTITKEIGADGISAGEGQVHLKLEGVNGLNFANNYLINTAVSLYIEEGTAQITKNAFLTENIATDPWNGLGVRIKGGVLSIAQNTLQNIAEQTVSSAGIELILYGGDTYITGNTVRGYTTDLRLGGVVFQVTPKPTVTIENNFFCAQQLQVPYAIGTRAIINFGKNRDGQGNPLDLSKQSKVTPTEGTITFDSELQQYAAKVYTQGSWTSALEISKGSEPLTVTLSTQMVKATAKAEALNPGEIMILAVYDRNMKLNRLSISEQWNGGKDLELNVALHPEDMGGWVKVFVWNSLNKLEPRLFRSRYLSEEAIARQ